MKKKLLWVLLPIGLLFLYIIFSPHPTKKSENAPLPTQKPQNTTLPTTIKNIFVPYWGLEIKRGDLPSYDTYDTYYYFGILPTKEGFIENDVGYKHISLVNSLTEKQKKLVLRMLDATVTEALLSDKVAQKTLITEVKNVLSKNAFSGLILDIEVPFTLQANKKEQITNFVQQMCTAIKTNYKTCDMLVYGDVIYRNRPYDLKKISEQVDTILLMAYDFHKPGGEPGPNFPFARRSSSNLSSEGGSFDYGYDFKTMVADVAAVVPKNKIEVVFGMYGYDWTMNEQGTPLKSATALSVQSLKSKVKSQKLTVETNEAKEKTINYSDEEGKKHIIWYEDEESAAIKTEYLQNQEIDKVSYWAYGYY